MDFELHPTEPEHAMTKRTTPMRFLQFIRFLSAWEYEIRIPRREQHEHHQELVRS